MVATETCPSLEDVAALLDGALADEERARLFHHIAECESCYELFAGAARLLIVEAPAAGLAGLLEATQEPAAPPIGAEVPAPPAKVVPLGWRRKPARVPWLTEVAALAALVLIAVVGVSTYRWWTQPPSFNSAALVEPFAGQAAELTGKRHTPPAYRGPNKLETPVDAQEFQVGVELVDLRVAARAGDWKSFVAVLEQLSRVTRTADFVGEEMRKKCDALAEKVRKDPAAQSPSRLAQSADRIEADLADGFQVQGGIHLSFGEWTEAARLGALAGRTDLFTSWTSRRFLRRLPEQKEDLIDPEILGRMRRVAVRAAHQPLLRADLEALAGDLDSVIQHYDRLVAP